jgi:hypothetical protein
MWDPWWSCIAVDFSPSFFDLLLLISIPPSMLKKHVCPHYTPILTVLLTKLYSIIYSVFELATTSCWSENTQYQDVHTCKKTHVLDRVKIFFNMVGLCCFDEMAGRAQDEWGWELLLYSSTMWQPTYIHHFIIKKTICISLSVCSLSNSLLLYQSNHPSSHCLCDLVVRVPGFRFRNPGFDSRFYQIFCNSRSGMRSAQPLWVHLRSYLNGKVAPPSPENRD